MGYTQQKTNNKGSIVSIYFAQYCQSPATLNWGSFELTKKKYAQKKKIVFSFFCHSPKNKQTREQTKQTKPTKKKRVKTITK